MLLAVEIIKSVNLRDLLIQVTVIKHHISQVIFLDQEYVYYTLSWLSHTQI